MRLERRNSINFTSVRQTSDSLIVRDLRQEHPARRLEIEVRRSFLIAAALIACVIPATASAAPAQTHQAIVDELVAADKSFAAAAADKALIEGLLPMFDSETVMPAPSGFVKGREAIAAALAGNPANAGAKASWTPVRGGISADGKHGFTIGFMDITAEGKPARKAKYVAYWIKRPAGWRVAVYKRAPRSDGEVSLALMPPSLPETELKPATDAATLAAYRTSLDKAERDFSDLALKIGIGPAFVQNGRPDATNIGAGPGFTVGNDKIGADVAVVQWTADPMGTART